MSGFAVAFGNVEKQSVGAMIGELNHRGPDRSGILENGRVCMAQNYLKADGMADRWEGPIPVVADGDDGPAVCFDGQIGNRRELASELNVPEGPLNEERLMLELYRKHGKEMLSQLAETLFAFAISDGRSLFAARDVLGIKTLFYGRKDGTLYLASELKALLKATDDVNEFPPGHYMDESGALMPFAQLPQTAPPLSGKSEQEAVQDIRSIILSSFHNRIDFDRPTGSLLSGGIDSSVIAGVASKAYKERYGNDAQLPTFSLGVGESQDIINARAVAAHLGTDHHELIIDLDEILSALPEVIYYLESFDPSLVRSAASNFLVSRNARKHGIEVLLSGEGGDEVFCGYIYLKDYPPEQQFSEQVRCLGFLHNNASLRLDRMNQCNGVKVVAPLISGRLLDYALALPPEFKQCPAEEDKIEKYIFRKAFENDLPHQVVWRLKQEFSQGSGSAGVLPDYFDRQISDAELASARDEFPFIRGKEELAYFRIFTDRFGTGKSVATVGQWPLL